MKKKIIAVVLSILAVLPLAACARRSGLGDETTSEKDKPENIQTETKANFLVMGHDRAANLTDVIMIVSFDTETGEMAITQIPRDTYFEADDYSYHKINGLFNYYIGKARDDGSSFPEKDALKMTADYFSKHLDIKIHHSAVMDLDGFGDIVDSVGGVYMYIPYSMYYSDPGQNLYINLPEGYCNMDGDQAEQFVRFRSGYLAADLARGDAQKMFMTAFIESVKKNISLTSIDDIASAILASVITDMSVGDIVTYGKAVLGIELSNVTMMTLPGQAAMCDGASYYVMNRKAVMELMQKHYNIYKTAVDDESFDSERAFCNDADSVMSEVYYSEDFETVEHNAQDISDNDIDIALK